MSPKKRVLIVDDDSAVRESLALLMRSVGVAAECYGTANDLLDGLPDDEAGACLLLDVRMPGLSGIDLQQALIERGSRMPIVFITGHGDIPMAVQAMKRGAVDFLTKPLRDQDVVDCVQRALDVADRRDQQHHEQTTYADRESTLTPREREIMALVVDGLPNKAIAADLDISERTVEVHRAKIMHKLGATSLAHLVRMALVLRGETNE